MKSCVLCEWQGPEFPAEAAALDLHRALHNLGRVLVDSLEPIVAALVKVRPLENLDKEVK
ncbi:hypothetical protein PBI_ANDREW_65 [Arthrobacter phage Andrew]|uniref:Uncharacterized protein n=1 Tax=Arthrobacter phage Andrew TaxID=2419946 RepID=A0A3G2KCZ8_9CAUD|nr:hypothetical protein HOU53_gp65 [Arthrobacter phage Andrew]AYN56878.1 hypothetical protein PBI_ANDREW_65 [Arthrobacter phage Andrew]